MPTLEISNGFYRGGFVNTLMNSGGFNLSDMGLFGVGSTQNWWTAFAIMKGTVPTDFSALTGQTSRSTDELIKWQRKDSQFTIDVSSNPVVFSTPYLAATQSGTATWFRLWVGYQSNLYHQVVGTVGVTGSGSDLEMADTNIILGNPYRVNSLRLQIPTSWTF